MSSTPKAVRRNHGNCVCNHDWATWKTDEGTYDEGTCRYGYCFSAKCRKCRGEIWGMGPVACKCEGAPRWARHRHMAPFGHWDIKKHKFVVTHAAVKPSIARRTNRAR